MEKDLLIEIGSSQSEYKILESEILRALEKALKIMNKENVILDVGLLTGEEMAEINEKFRDKEGPTNVLSFEEPVNGRETYDNSTYLGDIYLCPDVIKERNDDIIHLSIHGLLHLLGYTHKDKSDTIKMEQKEEELLSKINND